MKIPAIPFSILLLIFCLPAELKAQDIPQDWFRHLEYRFAGPHRGGRSTAVAGVPRQPFTFYMGATGGGVWKTDDAGNSWNNVSDGQIECGSIGSIAVAPSNPDLIFVGTGSDSPRGNVSPGIGLYKSINAGKDWQHVGLNKCGQIGDLLVHPENSDVVYAAALGNIFGPNQERGVFKTTDGGVSWQQVFYLDDSTGAVDLAMHPNNPDIVFAGMWRAERKPWTLIDGGYSGGLYKTVDAGQNWKKITNGLPEGLIGKIGISISPQNPNRIWVIQQAAEEEKGGVYRSDDGGASFVRVNRDHKLRQRGWYYSRIFADPKDENTVYVTNTGFYKSIDGGKSFDKRFSVPHGDCHDVWINPNNPQIMINSNDGGATVSLNGGKTWSGQNNQPTSELYRLTVDHQFPYRLYAGQQDNTTISVPSRISGGLSPTEHWHSVGGGESADVAVHPEQPNIVYATTYSGIITRVNLNTDERRDIGAYPHYTEGTQQRDLKYRWQWNFPIRISKFDPKVLYHCSNYVHRSTNEGQSWELISPDLSHNIQAYQGIPGGPIQHDATGVEVYSSIFSFEEDAFDANTLWVGTDDGRIQLTRDGGANWKDITPKQMPKEGTVNAICPSSHRNGTAYAVVYRYRDNDFKPYIFKTTNYGQSWDLRVKGIPEDHFVRAIDEDPKEEGLLFAGTEFGMYLSFDGGSNWQTFQQKLPHTPVTDLEVHGDDLVLSTQGRGFWIMDDINLLREIKRKKELSETFLFPVSDTYRSRVNGYFGHGVAPPSAPYQAKIHFYLDNLDTSKIIRLSIYNSDNQLVRSWDNKAKKRSKKLKVESGMNSIRWNLKYPAPDMVRDLVMMDMRYPGVGPDAPPGTYRVELEIDQEKLSQSFSIKKDPRWEVSNAALQANFVLGQEVSELITKSQQQIMNLRGIRKQIALVNENLKDKKSHHEIRDMGKKINRLSTKLEEMIYQSKIESSQDEINYPRKFTNHMIRLYRVVISQDHQPSAGELERWTDLQEEYKPFQKAYEAFVKEDLPRYEALLKEKKIPMILLKH